MESSPKSKGGRKMLNPNEENVKHFSAIVASLDKKEYDEAGEDALKRWGITLEEMATRYDEQRKEGPSAIALADLIDHLFHLNALQTNAIKILRDQLTAIQLVFLGADGGPDGKGH